MAAMEFVLVAEADRDRAIGTLVSAFEDDPVERWLYPDEADYRRHFPAFIAAFGGAAFRDRTVWRLGDFAAVAFWFGPEQEPDGDAVVQVRQNGWCNDDMAAAWRELGITAVRMTPLGALESMRPGDIAVGHYGLIEPRATAR
jgi:rhodanese-related sulfurtransferase